MSDAMPQLVSESLLNGYWLIDKGIKRVRNAAIESRIRIERAETDLEGAPF